LFLPGTIAALVSAKASHPVNYQIVKHIKENAKTWFPMEVEANPLRKMTTDQVLGLCGTNLRGPLGTFADVDILDDVPAAFDSRT
jgi:hypothetical protein